MKIHKNPSHRRLKKYFFESVKERLHSCNYQSGAECVFFDYGEYGLKVYWTKFDRDHAYRHQKYAYDQGYAPAVYQKVNLSKQRFGYFTQVAYEPVPEWGGKSSEECAAFQRELEDVGIRNLDLHAGNVRMLDGEIVVIDFGPIGSELVHEVEST